MNTTRGKYPWAIIPCKHRDKSAEPWTHSFLTDFFLTPGKRNVFDYWKEISFGNVSIEGSRIFDWVSLPYDAQPDFARNRDERIIAAAKEAAKRFDLKQFSGIIILFNSDGDGGAPSPSIQKVTLNNQTKDYGLVNLCHNSEKPGEMDLTFVLHEMGHGFGFEHSFNVPSLGDDGCYGDRTDLMSAMRVAGFNHPNPKWGSAGPGLNTPNLLDAGWLDIDYKPKWFFPVPTGPKVFYANRNLSAFAVELKALRIFRASENNGYRMLYYDLDETKTGACYLSFEFRQQQAWDEGLPAEGIVIHKVTDGVNYIIKPSAGRWIWGSGEKYIDAGVIFTFSNFDTQSGLAKITIENRSVVANYNSWRSIGGALKNISVGSKDNIWGVNKINQVFQWKSDRWEQQPGSLKQVSAASDGSVWGVNEQDKIYRWDGSQFIQVAGSLSRIAVGSNKQIWGVNSQTAIFRWSPAAQQFEQVPGSLVDISVGQDGVVCGTNQQGEIYWWKGFFFEKQEKGILKQVSVGNISQAWGVNAAGSIYRYHFDQEGWEQVDGTLSGIDAAEDGTVCGVNLNNEVFKWTGKEWLHLPGSLQQISVGAFDNIWGVNKLHQIFRWINNEWKPVIGALTTVAAGTDGSVWGVNGNHEIFHFNGTVFKQITGSLEQIAVGSSSYIWGVNNLNEVYQWNGFVFVKVDEGMSYVSANSQGDVWAIGLDESIFYWRNGRFQRFATGSLAKIAVGLSNTVWGINSQKQIFRLRPGRWLPIKGKLVQVSVGTDSTVMGVNEKNEIFINTPKF